MEKKDKKSVDNDLNNLDSTGETVKKGGDEKEVNKEKELNKEKEVNKEEHRIKNEKSSTFRAENSTFERNNILNGDGSINVEHNNYYSTDEVLGLPTVLETIDPNDIKFNVDSLSEQYTSLLLKEHFIVLNCAHDGIANNLKHTIRENANFESFLKYEIAFDDYSPSNISYLIEHCHRRILKDNQKLLLFIYDSQNNQTPKLLKSLTKINNLGKAKIINSLKDHIYIVYLSYHDNQNFLNTSCFSFHNIEAFSIYAENRSFSKERILIIRKQQSNGVWGNDRELLEDLDKYETDSEVENIILSKEEEKKLDFKAIIKNKKQPIARYVLFVATFFPKITPDVFREFVNTLLGNKTIQIKKKGVYLSEIWNDEADDILDDCHLISYNENNQRRIGFTSTTVALLCEQQLLKSVNFIDQQARILIESQELFTKNTSPKMYKRIFPIITKLSSFFRTYYGDELLKKWLITIEDQRKKFNKLLLEVNGIIEYIEQIENKTKEFEVLKDDLLEKLQQTRNEKNNISHQIYWNVDSFSNLLASIYNKNSSKDIVLEFFTTTFKSINQNHIVIDILSKFQVNYIDFNGFEYYKLALEIKKRSINQYAFQALINLFLNHPEHFYLFAERTKQWLPKEGTPYDSYTKPEKYILATLYVYLSTQMNSNKSDNRRDGRKTQHTLINNESDFFKYIHFIIHNIYNPHLVKILDELFFTDSENKKVQEDIITAKRAELIEYWYQLLKSVSVNQDIDKNVRIYIESIHEQLDTSQKKILIQELKKIRVLYNEQLLECTEAIDKQKIKTKRSNLVEFINLLKE